LLLISCSALPADGIVLRPSTKDHDGTEGEAGLGGGVASTMMGGASIHDESFEDEFSDMEGSITDGNTGKVIQVISGLELHVHVHVYMYVCICTCTCIYVTFWMK
jgi:hypothetical protein